jgi:hypothetical protein
MESDNSAQEDKSAQAFDALLDAQLEGVHNSTVDPGNESASALAVGERIAAGQAIVPSPDFAQTLKARFLERAERMQSDQSAAAPVAPVAPPPTNPNRPARLVGARYVRDVLRSRRVQVATLAATLLIAMGAGLLLAAMSAPPASPLYPIRRLGQSIRVEVATNKADAAQLHVTYADQALAALTDAAQNHDVEGYRAALATLVEEDSAAATAATTIPPGDQRAQVEAAVAHLRTREVAGLRAALPALGWHDRITTTSALASIGADTLSITNAEVSKAVKGKGSQHLWQVTVVGHGFQPGAVLLISEIPRGVIVSVTNDLLIAQVEDGPIQGNASIGVGNPDNTAASTNHIIRHDASDDSQATPSATPTPGNGGNSHDGEPTPTHSNGGGKP